MSEVEILNPSPERERRVQNDLQLFSDLPMSEPLAYFITFTTYGSWLHGDERGSVDESHNIPGTPFVAPNAKRRSHHDDAIVGQSVKLDRAQRSVVHRTIEEVCAHRKWKLHAINVRTNHVHVIVAADCAPEKVLNDLKSWSTRRLRESGLHDSQGALWTHHGSTRYLWNEEQIVAAGRYVVEGQGEDI